MVLCRLWVAMACISWFAYVLNVVVCGWLLACYGLLVRRKILRLYWLSPLWLLREDCWFKLRWLASPGLLMCLMLSHVVGCWLAMGCSWDAKSCVSTGCRRCGCCVRAADLNCYWLLVRRKILRLYWLAPLWWWGGDGVVKCDGEVGVLLGVFLYL